MVLYRRKFCVMIMLIKYHNTLPAFLHKEFMTTAHSAHGKPHGSYVACKFCLAITPDKHHSTKLWYFIYAANPGIQPCSYYSSVQSKKLVVKNFSCG